MPSYLRAARERPFRHDIDPRVAARLHAKLKPPYRTFSTKGKGSLPSLRALWRREIPYRHPRARRVVLTDDPSCAIAAAALAPHRGAGRDNTTRAATARQTVCYRRRLSGDLRP